MDPELSTTMPISTGTSSLRKINRLGGSVLRNREGAFIQSSNQVPLLVHHSGVKYHFFHLFLKTNMLP